MNFQRINAIFEKDMKDFMKNTMLLFMPVTPILLAALYSQMSMGEGDGMPISLVYLVVGVVFSTTTSGLIMIMMAEENEKMTLRGLIMSPASFWDIIIGKSLVTALLTLVTLIISLLFTDIEHFFNIKAMTGLILLFLFFLFLGMGVGLFVKSVGITSAYLLPIMFLFGFTPMFEAFNLADTAMKVAETFPIIQLLKMHEDNSWAPLGVVSLWVIGAALFAYICFIRTRRDD
ncbi:ABC transporter permease [Virgibacillus sp. MSJ-26]|uniref:ABC transporter permease n=1 Tax=Virgibacillus sp. MSJ-26 TaxID=2841522 RepID=UPI001C0FB105|nr:ABC transporter permease [Virgibacillus sp. MSJ-26]MBU5466882.1 ABC transporter permease [Virgibacillus sp. MSJ-26]